MTAAAARARGLVTTIVAGESLAAIDRARDVGELAAALARAGLPAAGDAEAIDRIAIARIARDFASLARWTDELAVLELDEDRRTLRALVRGLAGGASLRRLVAGSVPTKRLTARTIASLGAATTIAELAARLVHLGHPLAPALGSRDRASLDVIHLELALAHRFVELARPRDHALRVYVAQMIDTENAIAALHVAARGAKLDLPRAFLAGGRLVDLETFLAAATASIENARARIASALAGTPLAAALFDPAPAALDDASLAWQLQTQARLRRIEPLELAPAVYTLLRRRDEARHLRRAAWRVAMGAA